MLGLRPRMPPNIPHDSEKQEQKHLSLCDSIQGLIKQRVEALSRRYFQTAHKNGPSRLSGCWNIALGVEKILQFLEQSSKAHDTRRHNALGSSLQTVRKES